MKRMYWKDSYSTSFECAGLEDLFRIFGPATGRSIRKKWLAEGGARRASS